MDIRTLAESIILQSIEDLWHREHREGSLEFFSGEGFELAAELAGLSNKDKRKLLALFANYTRQPNEDEKESAGMSH